MKINLPGLHGGISQQAAALRMMNQHTDVNNVVCDVVDGLRFPRPGTTRIAMGLDTGDEGILGTIRTTDGYLWVIYRLYEGGVVDSLVLKRFSSSYTAVETVWVDVSTNDYLKKGSGRLRLVTILDTVFIVNRDVVVNLDTTRAPDPAAEYNRPTAFLRVPQAYETFQVVVGVTLKTTVATTEIPGIGIVLASPSTSFPVAAGVVDPAVVAADIAKNLYTTYVNATSGGQGEVIMSLQAAHVEHGGVIYRAKVTHTADASSEPGVGASWTTYWEATAISPTSGTFSAWASGVKYYYLDELLEAGVEMLPSSTGSHPVVVYSATTLVDPLSPTNEFFYYTVAPSYEELIPTLPRGLAELVVFSPAEHYYVYYSPDDSAYIERCAPGQKYHLNSNTLPQMLRWDGAMWTLSSPDGWGEPRPVGDSVSAPLPDFVGRKINDMFYYRDRLSFISDNYVVMSRVRDYYNFFPQTATEVLDNDPISVAPSSTAYFKIEWVKASGRQLVLLARERQYVLHSGYDALTPKTVVIDEVTNFQLANIEPLLMEESLLLATDSGSYVGVMEYKVMEQEVPTYGVKLSESIPRLITADYTNMVYVAGHSLVLIWKPGTTVVYTYKFHKKPDGALTQVAWTQWTMPSNVVSIIATDSDKLLILVEDDSSWMLMDLAEREGIPLDDREFFPGALENITCDTTQAVVDTVTHKQWEVESGVAQHPDLGNPVNAVRGIPIVGSVELSPFIPRDDNGLPRTDVATNIQSIEVNWEGGELEVNIDRRGLPTYTMRLTPEEYTEEECGDGQYYREPRPTRAMVLFPAGRTTITLKHVGTRYTSVNNFAYNVHFTKDRA